MFGVASVADAHFLSKKRAQTATLNYQADQCNSNPSYADCYGAAAGPQKRLTLHKVRVLGHIFGIVAGTTQPYDCERIFIWRIKAGKPASKLFGRLKAETCFDDWDGHGTPPVLRKDAGRKASLDVLEDGPRTILSG